MTLTATFFAAQAHAQKLELPRGTSAVIDKIYSFDTDGAIADAQRLQSEQPDQPLGYLLEAEALWWKIFCTSAEFKYGMTDARHRPKLAADQHYLDLAAKASSIALAQLKIHETAEMQFYAGMGDAFSARLYGLRGENRTTARFGVHAREHFLRAFQLDPELADAEFGLGLYNYYVDTMSGIAKLLSFFMGIPGGSKQEGIRQLEQDMTEGVLTPAAARFYLALNLHRYDLQYEKALGVIGPARREISFQSVISTCQRRSPTPNWAAGSRPSRATVRPRRSTFKMQSAAPIFRNLYSPRLPPKALAVPPRPTENGRVAGAMEGQAGYGVAH